ncbi:epimerase [Roseivirga pacifica]|uniref:epimerase n=1 Tax=Roseivirga pacifica TaxID=1267423 RepID=UPI003BAE3AA5
MKVILFGATGMVGEGILIECLHNSQITKILSIGRKSSHVEGPKLDELLVSDIMKIDQQTTKLNGFDAVFYCLGKSSNGMSEEAYTSLTHDLTIHIGKVLKDANPNIIFCFISGAGTDTTEKSRLMWARVKGKTENDLIELYGQNIYNFRPGLMKPIRGQKSLKGYNWIIHKALFPILKLFMPYNNIQSIARAMIHVSKNGNEKQILEVTDINHLSIPQLAN